jgi:translation initiation factor 1
MAKKKKMQKLDLNNFFIQSEPKEGFKVLQENDTKEPENTASLSPNAQKLFVRKEKKGRGGKTVTVVEGYQGNPQTLEQLCKKVKQQCGVGGSVNHKTFIIQGDKADQVVKILIKAGYNAKKTTM